MRARRCRLTVRKQPTHHIIALHSEPSSSPCVFVVHRHFYLRSPNENETVCCVCTRQSRQCALWLFARGFLSFFIRSLGKYSIVLSRNYHIFIFNLRDGIVCVLSCGRFSCAGTSVDMILRLCVHILHEQQGNCTENYERTSCLN